MISHARRRLGRATLYRHFPTRDALIEAVYRSEVEKLAAAKERFVRTMTPLDALRTWMLLLIDHVAAKTLILPVMDTVPGGSLRLMEGSRSVVHGSFLALVQRAIDSGDLRAETDPHDFVRALVGGVPHDGDAWLGGERAEDRGSLDCGFASRAPGLKRRSVRRILLVR